MPIYIYVLKDPRDGAVRYVGKTKQPEKRIRDHQRIFHDAHLMRWIKELALEDKEPLMEIARELDPDDDATDYEAREVYRQQLLGADLFNKNLKRYRKTLHTDLARERAFAIRSAEHRIQQHLRDIAMEREWIDEIKKLPPVNAPGAPAA